MAHSIFGWSLPPGCTSVPGDEYWTQQLSSKEYHASTDYRCDQCGDWIKKGELYRYSFFITEDGTAKERSHIQCPWEYEYYPKLEPTGT